MVSKTSFIVLGLLLAVVLLISSEVAAKDLETAANGVEDPKYEDNNGGGRAGNINGRGGYNGNINGRGGYNGNINGRGGYNKGGPGGNNGGGGRG